MSMDNLVENTPKNGLVFGVMCNGLSLQKWQMQCVEYLLQEGHRPGLLIVDNRKTARESFWSKTLKYLGKKGLYLLMQRFFFRPDAKKLVDFPEKFQEVDRIKCDVSLKGFSEYFSPEDVARIKSHKLDFILRFGFNIIRGEMLFAAKYGIWSFHHDDEQKYRGGPPGFWEIVKNNPVTGVILQRLTEKLDSGIILRKGYLKTVNHSYDGQIDQLFFDASIFPLQVGRDIQNGVAQYFENEPVKSQAPIFKAPSNVMMLGFLIKLLKNKIRFQFEEFFRPEFWNMALVNKPANEVNNLEIELASWLPKPPKGSYFADPFCFLTGDTLKILFEDYDYQTRKGKISQLDFYSTNAVKMSTAIEEIFHLSYPFIFENEGTIYCLPESASANQVRLYKFENEKFVFQKVLIDQFPGVDSTLFFYKNHWWILTTHRQQSNTALYVFYGENFDGPYISHKNNPVKMDIRSARPAGVPFYKGDKMIRPAQDSSKTYGGQIALNKIVKLTPEEFLEETTEFISPCAASHYSKGLHTLSGTRNFTIIDGKRFQFNWHHFFHKLREKTGF